MIDQILSGYIDDLPVQRYVPEVDHFNPEDIASALRLWRRHRDEHPEAALPQGCGPKFQALWTFCARYRTNTSRAQLTPFPVSH